MVSMQEIHISHEDARQLRKNMPGVLTRNEFKLFNYREYYGDIFKECINPTQSQQLQNFKNDGEITVLVVRGLPTDIALPPTPYTGHGNLFDISLAASLNIALYSAMQITPVTYKGENDGRMFRDVVPKKTSLNEKSSYGSKYTLGMHVDDCHLPLAPEIQRKGLSIAPEYLSLYGLRCDLRVATKLAFIDKAILKLDPQTVDILKQPLFELTMPDSFESHEKFILPLLVQDEKGNYYARFDKEYTRILTKEAEEAFKKFETFLYDKENLLNLFLMPGDFLIFKNQRMTHSREAFEARFDGTDRWLLRLFGVNCLSRTVPVDTQIPYCLKAC